MLFWIQLHGVNAVAFVQVRQELVTAAYARHSHEPVKNKLASDSLEHSFASASLRADEHRGCVELSGRHLTCHEAFPNELVQFPLFVFQSLPSQRRLQSGVGRPNRLVRLLSGLAARIRVWLIGQVSLAKLFTDESASHLDGFG